MTGFSALPLSDDPETANDDGDAHFEGVARILGPRWSQLPVLTVGLIGVQIMWSVEMSYASPYLISLGMTKSLMAMVFLAGPISGLIVQPLIGVLADNSKSRFGRRRPYILSGVVLCSIAMLLLGFTRQTANILTSVGSSANDALTVGLAILAIYCIDFGINAVQAVDRALLVDTLPPSTQASGNAWAARMLGIGSVAGFFIGNIDLPKIFPNVFGEHRSELQILSVLSSLLMIGTHLWTASMVKERIFIGSRSGQAKKGFRREMRELWTNALSLPYVIRQICIIQFFAWLAWFPILFYTTLYIGDLYRRSLPTSTSMILRAPEEPSATDDEATRLGARAQLYSALLALATNILAPFIVSETRRRTGPIWQGSDLGVSGGEGGMGWWKKWWNRMGKIHLATLWAVSHAVFTVCMFATFFTDSVAGATLLMSVTGFSWGVTQWAPFSLLAEAILTTPDSDEGLDPDDTQSILLADTRTPQREEEQFLVGRDDDDDDIVVGGVVTNRSSQSRSRSLDEGAGVDGEESDTGGRRVARTTEDEIDDSEDDGISIGQIPGRDAIMANAAARRSGLDMAEGNEDRPALDDETYPRRRPKQSGLAAKAGIIIGIHNIFIVVPQFLVTGLSSLIFAIFEPDKSTLHGTHPGHVPPGSTPNNTMPGNSTVAQIIGNTTYALLNRQNEDGGSDVVVPEGPNTVAIIFRLGGLSSAVAFVICWRLARELRKRY